MRSRTRNLLSIRGRQRRYLDTDDIRDLEEIAKADTLADESKTSLREWVAQNVTLVVALSLLATALFVFIAWQAARFVPAIVSNPYVQILTGAGVVAAASYRFGGKRKRQKIGDQWRLTLRWNDDDSVTRLGTYVDGPGGGYFVPIKGFRRGSPRPYTIGELEASFDQVLTKPGLSNDDPAIIMLHPKYTNVRQTEHGNYVDVRTDDLTVAEQSPAAALRTTVPEYDEEDVNDLAERAEKQAKRAQRLEDRLSSVKKAYNDVIDQLDEPVEERVDKRLAQYQQLALALGGGRRRSSSGEVAGDGEDFRGADTSGFGAPGIAGGAGQVSQSAVDEAAEDIEDDEDDDE